MSYNCILLVLPHANKQLPQTATIYATSSSTLFLAHLSRRLIWWAYRIGRPPSYVVVHRPHSLNIFSSETTGPIKVIFHMELLWDGGTKVCSKGPGHLTNMAAMPIYGKNLKKSSSAEPKGWWPWNLVCIIGCSSTTNFSQMMTLGWPWPILWQGQVWVPYAFVWEKGKTMDFSEGVVVYDLKLATDDRNNNKFLLTSKHCPLGAVCPLCQGYIHILNHEKNCIRDFFETCNKWPKWQDVLFDIKILISTDWYWLQNSVKFGRSEHFPILYHFGSEISCWNK